MSESAHHDDLLGLEVDAITGLRNDRCLARTLTEHVLNFGDVRMHPHGPSRPGKCSHREASGLDHLRP